MDKHDSSNQLILYHGSEHIVNPPVFGKGEAANDYGRGFYLTEYPELASEWACPYNDKDGYVNKYEFSLVGMNVLDLDTEPFEHWVSLLVQNRDNKMGTTAKARMYKFVETYPFTTSGYDVIKGWRANDAYYAFIRSFFNVELSLESLKKAMYFGEYGVQYCLISKQSYKNIKYISCYPVKATEYYLKRIKRDNDAKKLYIEMKDKTTGTLILDIVGR